MTPVPHNISQEHEKLMRQLAIRSLMREQIDAEIRDLTSRIFTLQRNLSALAKESKHGRTDQADDAR